MITSNILQKVKKFHFKTRKLSNELFLGHYKSAFKGRGIEFSEVREYEPGDDYRAIDWNVSARFGKPYIKIFHEEREIVVILLVDISGSQFFGSTTKLKRELLAEVVGILAFVAVRANDKVGAILYSSAVEKFIPPKKGSAHVWGLIREVLAHSPASKGTDMRPALRFLNRVFKRRAVVFVISDFLDGGYYQDLKLCAKRHDLTLIEISDPREHLLPKIGLIAVEDPESKTSGFIDTNSHQFEEDFRRYVLRRKKILREIVNIEGIDLVEISTAQSVIKALTRFFYQRSILR